MYWGRRFGTITTATNNTTHTEKNVTYPFCRLVKAAIDTFPPKIHSQQTIWNGNKLERERKRVCVAYVKR